MIEVVRSDAPGFDRRSFASSAAPVDAEMLHACLLASKRWLAQAPSVRRGEDNRHAARSSFMTVVRFDREHRDQPDQ